jgi:crotonyl-CoA carboxylase/reductase
VWKVGEGVTRWKPGDEVVIHCNIASYEDPEVHGLDPLAAPSQMIWGYETTWGSFAQFTKVQAQQLLPKPRRSPGTRPPRTGSSTSPPTAC